MTTKIDLRSVSSRLGDDMAAVEFTLTLVGPQSADRARVIQSHLEHFLLDRFAIGQVWLKDSIDS
jgi:hypothetical protein